MCTEIDCRNPKCWQKVATMYNGSSCNAVVVISLLTREKKQKTAKRYSSDKVATSRYLIARTTITKDQQFSTSNTLQKAMAEKKAMYKTTSAI